MTEPTPAQRAAADALRARRARGTPPYDPRDPDPVNWRLVGLCALWYLLTAVVAVAITAGVYEGTGCA